MPTKAPDDSRIVSVRLPDDLLQRLNRYLDWSATHRCLQSTRNAAMREALSAWLDHQEQLAGLLGPRPYGGSSKPPTTASATPKTASPSIGCASCCGGLGSVSMPCWRPCEPSIKLTSRPSRRTP